jgi:hypothetical protein
MRSQHVSYGGWPNCWQLSAGDLEVIVTADVGPRIIRLGFAGGENQFFEHTPDLGRTGGSEFRSYGGHRFWIAPEGPRTMHPDNVAVEVEPLPELVRFTAPAEPSGIQRRIEISMREDSRIRVSHRVYNRGKEELWLAPWALSVMAPGGTAILPLTPRAPHGPQHLLPDTSLAMWSYTDLSDPRWRFSPRLIRLQHAAAGNRRFAMQKIGLRNLDGWLAYYRNGFLFMKRSAGRQGAYPDRDCNLEVFTNEHFIEVETLGPMADLAPGGSVEHVEHWSLTRDFPLPEDDTALFETLAAKADTLR